MSYSVFFNFSHKFVYFVERIFIQIRSEHEANTERLVTKSTSMRHQEGGWPRDVDFTEQTGLYPPS